MVERLFAQKSNVSCFFLKLDGFCSTFNRLIDYSLNRMLNDGSDIDHEELEPLAKESEINADNEQPPQHALWVEKYTPKYFTELLSDDVSRGI